MRENRKMYGDSTSFPILEIQLSRCTTHIQQNDQNVDLFKLSSALAYPILHIRSYLHNFTSEKKVLRLNIENCENKVAF